MIRSIRPDHFSSAGLPTENRYKPTHLSRGREILRRNGRGFRLQERFTPTESDAADHGRIGHQAKYLIQFIGRAAIPLPGLRIVASGAVMLTSLEKHGDAHPRAIGDTFRGDPGQSDLHKMKRSAQVGMPVVQFRLFGGVETVNCGEVTGNTANAADILRTAGRALVLDQTAETANAAFVDREVDPAVANSQLPHGAYDRLQKRPGYEQAALPVPHS